MKTIILFLVVVLLFFVSSSTSIYSQQRGTKPHISIPKQNQPLEKSATIQKSFPVENVVSSKRQLSENENNLINKIREARKSGDKTIVQKLQKELNELQGIVSKQGKPIGIVKKTGKNVSQGDNINVSQVQSSINTMGITTVTEQRGDNIGRIWTIAINNTQATGNGAGGDYCETNFYFSDDGGINWYYYAYAYNPYEIANPDEIDAEIIEDFSGTKYMHVVYGAKTNSSGKYICNLITLDISGTVNGIVQRLEWPGFDYFSTDVNYYKPRITSDNAFWSGGAYIYIAACQDSLNVTNYDFCEKVAMITNPYTPSPSVDFKPDYFFYFSPNNGFYNGCCDIAWFDDPGNGGGSVELVESGAFFFTALYLYETTDVGYLGPSAYEGYLDPDGINKASAYIASNGLYENLMIVNISKADTSDFDIQYFSSDDAGSSFSYGYVSYTSAFDQRADVAGFRNIPGRFNCAFADFNFSFDNVFFCVAENGNWGTLMSPLNTIDASVECSPRPGLRLGYSDSCFVVWSQWYINSNVWASAGCSGSLDPVKALGLGVLIEGYYTPYQMTRNDSLTVTLREAVSPYNPVESKKLILFSSGNILLNYTEIDYATDYYVVVNHRSSIETWSAAPINFNFGYNYYYEFITSDSLAYGNNEKFLGNDGFGDFYGIYSGDVNQDGVIDATDLSLIDNDAFNFVTGYFSTDVDGNDFVDASDASIADNNAFDFVSKITP